MSDAQMTAATPSATNTCQSPTAPVLRVEDLTVTYAMRRGPFTAVDGVSLTIQPGEILGLVGESGAGKSTVGNAIAGLIDPPGKISRGRIILRDIGDMAQFAEKDMTRVRGRHIGMIFQDPLTALSPVMSIKQQLLRAIHLATGLTGAAARERALALLDKVGIPDPATRLNQYPHQFSGGMRQRIVIAIALAGDPGLLIADEPTTALDVSIQAGILELIRRLSREHQAGIILVTHDMAVINDVADSVAVMRRGRLVEYGSKTRVITHPGELYTKALIRAVPRTDMRLSRFASLTLEARPKSPVISAWLGGEPVADSSDIRRGEPIVHIEDIDVTFPVSGSTLPMGKRQCLKAVDAISFDIRAGETFGLVGESGSGKSTLARAICGQISPSSGCVRYLGHDLRTLTRKTGLQTVRLSMQMIFQDPFSSLNPRQRVGILLSEPLRVHGLASSARAQDIVVELLECVGLHADDAGKLPHQFSGGQRQRISIARALALRPRFLICDEPTSALDVSVQAQVLNLLKDLRDNLGLTMLFISHDLAVIRQMCDRIAVMKSGQICELAAAEDLFERPRHDYTRHLLAFMPRFAPDDQNDRAQATSETS